MAPPRPPRDTTEPPTATSSSSNYPSVTSRVASVAPVRRPLPPDVAPDTRIRRLHLRKGAWWAWAPRHDPADDHLYGWLRLDDETQQLITSRLARLEVPELIVEKDEKATASKSQVTPAYDNVVAAMREVAPSLASPHLFAHTYNNVVAAMRDVASIPTSRRLFKAVRDSERKRFSVDAVADDARDATFLADPLCIQSSSTCSTCGASRTYAPKGKFQTPGQYADEATPECRRGIGSDSCGRTEAAGNNPMLKTLCNPDAIAVALQRGALPFIQFFSAGNTPPTKSADATTSVVAAMTTPIRTRLTPMRILLYLQRECRRRIVRKNYAARMIQSAHRLRVAARSTAAALVQTHARRRWLSSTPRHSVIAALSHLPASIALSTSCSTSLATSEASSSVDSVFDEEDIAGRDDSANPLAYCAYLKNVRIAQRWEDGKKRRYRLNSACCWMRSTIADSGAGPSVIGRSLLHSLPPDAVVRHVPCAARISPVIGPSGERLLMLGTVSIVFAVEGRPYTHRFEVVDGGDLFILGNDFLAAHKGKVEPHLPDDPVDGFVRLSHHSSEFSAALVNDPNHHVVAAPVIIRPEINKTEGAAAAVLAALTMIGTPPAISDARQFALSHDLPYHTSAPITPADLVNANPALGVRGGVVGMERQLTAPPSTVASISGHPTAGFSVTDAETAAAQLNGNFDQDQGSRDHHPGGQPSIYTSDPSMTAAMPDDDTSPVEAEDDDGLEHAADNTPFSAPPKDYKFSPWEELKTHSNLLYSLAPIEVRSKSMATVRLKVPTRLESYAGPVEVSPPEIRHRLDHGLVVARTVGYVDPLDGCIPVQISNFTHRHRSIGSLIPVCQIDFESIVVHDRRSSPSDTSWDRLPPKTRRALEKITVDASGILTPEQKARVFDLLARHHAAFSTDSKIPGATHLLEVSVDLKPGSLPFRHAPSRTGTAGEKIIADAVAEMEAAGIIRKSTSQWASRVVLVSKKNSPDPRFCVDLRDLNSRLVVLDTPLPRCDDALDRLGVATERSSTIPPNVPGTASSGDPCVASPGSPGTASPGDTPPLAGTTGTDSIDAAPRALKLLSANLIYNTLDLTAGFWNLPVKESHRERLAFVTSKGKWEFTVLPFGLMTGPSYMQRMIEATLVGLSWELCLPYLDDVIIWANGETEEAAFEQSMERLELVLERLEWAGLRAKTSKSHLFATSVDYLGHVCSRTGVSLDPKKISAVSTINPRSINNLETVRSFLGLAGYYRNHIANFHVLSSPLVDLTKAGVDVPTESQKPEAQAAVIDLIKALCSDPVLMYPRSDREFIVATDAATGVGVGACLKQVEDDGTERVVSYHGRRFNNK